LLFHAIAILQNLLLAKLTLTSYQFKVKIDRN